MESSYNGLLRFYLIDHQMLIVWINEKGSWDAHLKMGRGWKVGEPWVGKTSSQLEGRSTANSREESFLESTKRVGKKRNIIKILFQCPWAMLEETIWQNNQSLYKLYKDFYCLPLNFRMQSIYFPLLLSKEVWFSLGRKFTCPYSIVAMLLKWVWTGLIQSIHLITMAFVFNLRLTHNPVQTTGRPQRSSLFLFLHELMR